MVAAWAEDLAQSYREKRLFFIFGTFLYSF